MSDVAKTPREELECKKKYLYEHSMFWECNDGSKCQILEEDVCEKLNEQQELIEELQVSDEMGWKRAEHFEKKCPKELHNKKMYIKRLEYKVQKFKRDIEELGISIKLFEDDIATKDKKIDEQQATIERLQKKIDNISNSYEKFYGVKLKYAHWLQGDD